MNPHENSGSFDYLRERDVTSSTTSVYVMTELEPSPRLVVRPATEANKAYFNEALRRQRNLARTRKITVATVEQGRDVDRDLYPQFVIVGWERVYARVQGENGEPAKLVPVPYSREACRDFIAALPGYVLDGLRTFCSDAGSFVEEMEPVDVEELLGNSPSD